jgi:hypothetical protein
MTMDGIAQNRDARAQRRRGTLCVETQGRDIVAGIVHHEVNEAMRLGLHDTPAVAPDTMNGAPVRRRTNRIRNG